MAAGSLEIPSTGDKKDIGDVTHTAVQLAYDEDSLWSRAVSKATTKYLKGERNFNVMDPFDSQRTLIRVELEDGFPTHEAVISDVNTEIGKQQLIDIAPTTRKEVNTLTAARDRAVTQGLLSYHFSRRVIDRPNRIFHRLRVIEGCSGLAVTPTVYPGFGWGLKVINIPLRELVFLPIRTSEEDLTAIAWRQWLPLNAVKSQLEALAITEGERIAKLPAFGTEEYSRLMVRDVPYGEHVGDREDFAAGSHGLFSHRSRSETGLKKHKMFSKFLLFVQIFFSRDMVHLDRRMILAGRHLVYDKTYPDFERPQMPIAKSTYAEVGGPYGRSYAQARMAINMRDEETLTALLRNFKNIDTYGLLAISNSMGVSIDDMFKQGDGYKVVNYSTDPGSPSAQPHQLNPIPLDRAIGRALGLTQLLSNNVFPGSPLDYGQPAGRVDSDKAYGRLERLGRTSIKAGAESARAAWIQIYRAGLEMARNHHSEGDKIPIFHLTPDLAGVIIDVEEVPKSQQEAEVNDLRKRFAAASAQQQGRDPFMAADVAGINQGVLSPSQTPMPDLVPVPRFSIGPNVIPSPNEVTIDIRSMLPRDEDSEFMEVIEAVKLGAASIMEAQIELLERGTDRFFGGRIVHATYRTAVLNLLSAFGNGIEAGPILIQPHLFTRQVGYWVVASFIADPLFGLASQTVKNQVMTLLYQYAPVNQVGGQLSADEAAALFSMQQRQQMQQEQGLQNQMPQIPQGMLS